MSWTTDEAIAVLEKLYPKMTVTIADGGRDDDEGYDYEVGTIEGENEVEVSSFMFIFEPSAESKSQVVKSIRVGRGNRYCGRVKPQNNWSTAHTLIPIQVTHIDEHGSTWGRVGDYEVCVNHADLITTAGGK